MSLLTLVVYVLIVLLVIQLFTSLVPVDSRIVGVVLLVFVLIVLSHHTGYLRL